MNRVVGLRRARRIKRVLFLSAFLVGVMFFWRLSRRDSEFMQVKGQGASKHQEIQWGFVKNTSGSTVKTPKDGVTGGANSSTLNVTAVDSALGDDKNTTTQKSSNSVTNSRKIPPAVSLNVSSKTNAGVGDNGRVEEKWRTHGNITSLPPSQRDNAIEPNHEHKGVEGEDGKSATLTPKPSGKPRDHDVNTFKSEGKLSNETHAKADHERKQTHKPLYEYSEPRYSVSENGQFQLMKFVTGDVNVSSFNQALKYSPFNQNDKVYLTLLSQGQIREIYSIEHHAKLRLVAFDAPTVYNDVIPIESCPLCGAIKSQRDVDEILAFHVDRTMGIDRALPATGRRFTQEELDNLGFDDAEPEEVFPVMWFARDLIHRGNFQKDQNSMQLSWKEYQDILAFCHGNSSQAINCTDVSYSDWSRMAVLDFVMQNHDRLDRYCCGYDTDEGEVCFDNEVRKELDSCEETERRFLVHILTTKSNPNHLVLLDNAGNIKRSTERLNYELLKGIRTIPKNIMESIYSEDFKDRLLKSLKWDAAYWKSMEDDVIYSKVDTIVQRVEKLRSYTKEHGIMAT